MSFFNPVNSSPHFLHSKALIIPIVSVANIAQLAVDLLITTFNLSLIGIFDAKDLVPVVGGRENGQHGVTTPLELYGKEGVDFVVIQQRSPAVKARKESFVQSILTFAQEYQFRSLLFLSGIDLLNRTDSQMLTPIYALVPPQSPPLKLTPLANIESLPRYEFRTKDTIASSQRQNYDVPFIPGGGLARRFLSALSENWRVPTACILQFVFEGDNRDDAILLASVIAKLFVPNHSNVDWKQPGSWNEGLFGTPHDQTLFG